jgi:biopolymer transport protein ExbD
MKSTNRQSPAINAGSMADIAFLLLVFFLVTTTVAKDEGLNRILPPKSEDSGPIPQRNVLEILVNKHNQLLVEGHFTEIENLRTTALEFILNKENEPNLPQKKIVTVDELGTIAISK